MNDVINKDEVINLILDVSDNPYLELIANLEAAGEWERLGELFDHERSNLYFQAANAIRQLMEEKYGH